MGGILKYLLLALAILWLFYSPAVRGLRKGGTPPEPKKPAKAVKAEAMVQCAQCGVHLPGTEALTDAQGHTYCSAAHRQAGPARS